MKVFENIKLFCIKVYSKKTDIFTFSWCIYRKLRKTGMFCYFCMQFQEYYFVELNHQQSRTKERTSLQPTTKHEIDGRNSINSIT
jgi:hypothetical protein